VICGGSGWGSHFLTPVTRDAVTVMMAVFGPCPTHGPELAPDRIEIPVGENRGPELGRDFVVIHDVCLAGEPAVNGRCADLDCVCAPSVLPSGTRVRQAADDAGTPFLVCEDYLDDTFTVMAEVGHKLHIRTAKSGWQLVGTLAFPIEPEVVS
jgi:hypothetical protein